MASIRILFLLCIIPCTFTVIVAKESQKLMVILFDGFRWDYVDRIDLPNFKKLINNGARAKYMRNDFPTLSYPNYYTLMTGLHTENHGMTGNFMYDKERGEYFLIGTNADQYNLHWWNSGEPLWVTALKQQKSTYMYYWPGCEVNLLNTTVEYCKKYTSPPIHAEDLRATLEESVELLTNGSAEFVGVYHEQPDYVGHRYGPGSSELATVLKKIDTELGNLLDMLNAVKKDQMINLIIMSDHGMSYLNKSKVIDITDTLNSEPGLYETIMEYVSLVSIYVQDGKKDRVFDLLKDFHPNMAVYKKEDIPEKYYYKHGKYVAEVTCVADPGWAILQPLASDYPYVNKTDYAGDYRGYHGWDNEEIEMRGIFYALGPYFKTGAEIEYAAAVDPYNIMCDILGITPAPNNGSRSRLTPLLDISGANDITSSKIVLVMSVVFCISFLHFLRVLSFMN